jgi:hypothetical protein
MNFPLAAEYAIQSFISLANDCPNDFGRLGRIPRTNPPGYMVFTR